MSSLLTRWTTVEWREKIIFLWEINNNWSRDVARIHEHCPRPDPRLTFSVFFLCMTPAWFWLMIFFSLDVLLNTIWDKVSFNSQITDSRNFFSDETIQTCHHQLHCRFWLVRTGTWWCMMVSRHTEVSRAWVLSPPYTSSSSSSPVTSSSWTSSWLLPSTTCQLMR